MIIKISKIDAFGMSGDSLPNGNVRWAIWMIVSGHKIDCAYRAKSLNSLESTLKWLKMYLKIQSPLHPDRYLDTDEISAMASKHYKELSATHKPQADTVKKELGL